MRFIPVYLQIPRPPVRKSLTLASLALLAACASEYQAPMDDRSTALERTPPLIVPSGQTAPATQRNAPQISSSGSGSSGAASSGPTAVSQGAVGASSTVVRPVAVGGGIGRTSLGRSPLTENDATDNPATGQSPASAAGSATASGQPSPSPASSTPTSASTSSAPAAPRSAGATTHTVARGDTLYSIAWTHSIDYRRLALANNLSAPYTIYPGQQLVLSESGVSESAVSALPEIPASPAGEAIADAGQRPQAAVDARRTGSVNTRSVEGVNWQWPADGRLLSTFTETGNARGVDISGMQGQAVYAAADGDVVYAGRGIQGAGNLVILRHSARHLSAYMYNRDMLVGEGDTVRAGDKIAEMGSGPNGRDMLHFEVRVDGKPVDPVRYLPNR